MARRFEYAQAEEPAAEIGRGKDFVQLKNGPFDLDLVVAEGAEPGQDLPVLHAAGGFLAADDVVGVTDREALHVDPAPPGLVEALDSVRREYWLGRNR